MSKSGRSKTRSVFDPRRGCRVLSTLDAGEVERAIMALSLDESMDVNGHYVVRKVVRNRKVGRDEWDVGAKRMMLREALEVLIPGRSLSALKDEG